MVVTSRSFAVLSLFAAFVACLAVSAAPASAAPPKCHGKVATKWSTKDVNRSYVGTTGRDVFVTGAGDDTIHGRKGNDIVCSRGGNDTVYGEGGLDRIYLGGGDDIGAGGHGDDVICGAGGRDALFGGLDSDWIDAGPGDSFFIDADGSGPEDASGYEEWIEEGYAYTYTSGSGGDDFMAGGLIHDVGVKLDKRWSC